MPTTVAGSGSGEVKGLAPTPAQLALSQHQIEIDFCIAEKQPPISPTSPSPAKTINSYATVTTISTIASTAEEV